MKIIYKGIIKLEEFEGNLLKSVKILKKKHFPLYSVEQRG